MPVLEGPHTGQAYYIANPTADEIIEHGYAQVIPSEAEQAFAAAFEHYEQEGVEEIMMDFGGAIAGVKAGHRLRREEWDQATPGKHIRLEGVDRVVVVIEDSVLPFIPTSADQLAEDWRYLNLPDTGDATAGDPLAQRTYAGQAGPGEIDGPTIPQETIDNGNATFVDTASVGPVPVAAEPYDQTAHVSPSDPFGQRGPGSPYFAQEADEQPDGHNVGGIRMPRVDGDGPA